MSSLFVVSFLQVLIASGPVLRSQCPLGLFVVSGSVTGVMTDEQFKTLDAMVIDISKCMSDLETHFPRANWTDSFKQ